MICFKRFTDFFIFMRLCIFMGVIIIPSPGFAAPVAKDKMLHFGVSLVAGYLAESSLHSGSRGVTDAKRVLLGTALGAVPGLIKEILDSNEKNNHFSGGDLAADIMGAFAGSLLANSINKRFMVNLQKNDEAYLVGFVVNNL